ncbi:Hypothetical protein NTJ_13506 [Nesidiocoris tenuis]|uniref:Uncharacterized protein n=1 Tax=Nesidiocoris tenuis TaxID=355587 RepID=A0ABN7B8H4_9HEMI|nr:Hypothetical protein NTJ_13506 [Nesidiocoris tenuis]
MDSSSQTPVGRSTHFRPRDDIIMLKEVLAENPFGDTARWATVRAKLVDVSRKEFSARAVKDRAALLIKQFTASERIILRKSGTEEEYSERERLLEEVKLLHSEFKNKKDAAAVRRSNVAAGKAIRAAAAAASAPAYEAVYDVVPVDQNDHTDMDILIPSPPNPTQSPTPQPLPSQTPSPPPPPESPPLLPESHPTPGPSSRISSAEPPARKRRKVQKDGSMKEFLAEKQRVDKQFRERELTLEERKVTLEENRLKLDEMRLMLEKDKREELQQLNRELMEMKATAARCSKCSKVICDLGGEGEK